MDVIDYGSSFLICKSPKNSVRFCIESRTRFIDEKRGITEDYYACAECKSENTFAEKDLFMQPNYNFLPIFGPETGVIFRRWAHADLVSNDKAYKSSLPVSQMWDGPLYEGVRRPTSVRQLVGWQAIDDATAAFEPIVAQTEIHDPASGRRVIIEHPVKTMNIDRINKIWQTDTGPVAFIDPAAKVVCAVDALSLAFIAFNVPEFADIVIESLTPVELGGKEVARVHHYSKILSLPAKNTLYALTK